MIMPPLTTQSAAEIVSGGILKEKSMSENSLKGKVIRAFYYGGKPLEVGTVVDLPKVFALEMNAAKKLAIIEATKEQPAPVKSAEGKKETINAVK